MKESVYNVHLLDQDAKKGLVYNTMHSSIVRIDEVIFNLLRKMGSRLEASS